MTATTVKSNASMLHTIGMFAVMFMFYILPFGGLFLTAYLLLTPFCPIMLLYLYWIYRDRETAHKAGRRVKWVRSFRIFQYFRNYFPQILVKTEELSPENNYLFCAFPHGILCTAAHGQFACENPEFNKLFPGITVTPHTLTINMYVPFTREYVLAMGFRSVSKQALVYNLTQGKGNASVVVVGGSAEAMYSSPGTHKLVLKNRKGFVKMAITTGAHLVPVYFFGENDLYRHFMFPKESKVHKIQQAIRKFTSAAPCIFLGRGFFLNFGILPFPKPVYTVVGRPIPVEKNENPTRDEVDALHSKFVFELTELFNKHKYKYCADPENEFLEFED